MADYDFFWSGYEAFKPDAKKGPCKSDTLLGALRAVRCRGSAAPGTGTILPSASTRLANAIIVSSRKNNCCAGNRYDEVYVCFVVRGRRTPPPPPPCAFVHALLVWKYGMSSLQAETEKGAHGSGDRPHLALLWVSRVTFIIHLMCHSD
ncbi:hypothetical protein RR46_03930 [Papilio xuthus]|uniref:Uncharacterized protein n=1 Tax=Papilio xuthus TaxID=66420 RepID=A0A194Q836_PAPXU|nr:hypothetical protein RR46_03930 [Papilio xuthus]